MPWPCHCHHDQDNGRFLGPRQFLCLPTPHTRARASPTAHRPVSLGRKCGVIGRPDRAVVVLAFLRGVGLDVLPTVERAHAAQRLARLALRILPRGAPCRRRAVLVLCRRTTPRSGFRYLYKNKNNKIIASNKYKRHPTFMAALNSALDSIALICASLRSKRTQSALTLRALVATGALGLQLSASPRERKTNVRGVARGREPGRGGLKEPHEMEYFEPGRRSPASPGAWPWWLSSSAPSSDMVSRDQDQASRGLRDCAVCSSSVHTFNPVHYQVPRYSPGYDSSCQIGKPPWETPGSPARFR